jgi:glycosyltransferase involved in cell wall biosynthesis
MKVLHVLSVEKPAFYFSNLVEQLDSRDVQFSFVNFAEDCPFSEMMRGNGFQVCNLGPIRKSNLPIAGFRLWKVLKHELPDVVHSHLADPSYLGLFIAKRLRKGTVLTRHHSDAIHCLSSPVKKSFYLWLEKRNNDRADHIIAPSKMVRKCVVEWEGTPSAKVSVIPYPQTSTRFDAVTADMVTRKRQELGMDAQLSLVCVSRLYHRKGHRYLFEALAPLIKDGLQTRLYLVGDGDFRGTLELSAKELGIADSIQFLGWRDDILEIIAASDIIVHPSLEDALSQSLIESLMLGRPIIATDISGASDTLDSGNYGVLVRPADSEAIRMALTEVIANRDAYLQKAANGKRFLLDYMNAERVAGEHLKVYKKVLDNHAYGQL